MNARFEGTIAGAILRKRGNVMKVQEILEKMRKADKITIQERGEVLFCGNVIRCRFLKELGSLEIEGLYPEMFGELVVNIKSQ